MHRREMLGASVEQKQVNIMYIGRVPIKIIKHQKIIMLILNALLYESPLLLLLLLSVGNNNLFMCEKTSRERTKKYTK